MADRSDQRGAPDDSAAARGGDSAAARGGDSAAARGGDSAAARSGDSAAEVTERVADAVVAREREKARDKGKRARELNGLIRYTMWSVFRVADPAALRDFSAGDFSAGDSSAGQAAPAGYGAGRDAVSAEVAELLDQVAGKGVSTRGSYDIQGLRADADYMFWWIADSPDDLQETYARFRRTRLGRASQPVWSVLALHRPAEFNKGHIPAFLADEEPRDYVSVYPFVRSYEWYLLDPDERRSQLAEHGMMARDYPDVRANTVACFALNDYEWILAFEADELHRLLDLMRHLRGARARRHTRVEIPFFTGRRKPIAELIAALP